MQHEAASLRKLGLKHKLLALTLPAGAALHDLTDQLAAPIQPTSLCPDLSAGAVQAVHLHHVGHAAAIEQGAAAVVLATAGEHPLIRFLPAGRKQILAGLLARFLRSSTECRRPQARRGPTGSEPKGQKSDGQQQPTS